MIIIKCNRAKVSFKRVWVCWCNKAECRRSIYCLRCCTYSREYQIVDDVSFQRYEIAIVSSALRQIQFYLLKCWNGSYEPLWNVLTLSPLPTIVIIILLQCNRVSLFRFFGCSCQSVSVTESESKSAIWFPLTYNLTPFLFLFQDNFFLSFRIHWQQMRTMSHIHVTSCQFNLYTNDGIVFFCRCYCIAPSLGVRCAQRTVDNGVCVCFWMRKWLLMRMTHPVCHTPSTQLQTLHSTISSLFFASFRIVDSVLLCRAIALQL